MYGLAWGWALLVAQTTLTSSEAHDLANALSTHSSTLSSPAVRLVDTSTGVSSEEDSLVFSPPTEMPVGPTEVSQEPSVTSSGLRRSKRERPNYDGRVSERAHIGDVLLWVPRVLLAPVHLVMEWGVRKPLGSLLTIAERDNWSKFIIDFLTFDDRNIGIIPTAFYDFNFRPSVGVYVFWNELFVKPHSIRLTAGYGGDDWYRVTFVDRWALGPRARLSFEFNYWARPDYIYAGEGVDGDPDQRTRYFSEYIDGSAKWELKSWRRSRVVVEAGVRHYRFDAKGSAGEGEQTLQRALEQEIFTGVSGGLDDYSLNFQRMLVEFDSRQHRPASSTGVRIAPYLSHGWDMRNPGERQWLGYGGTMAGFWDMGHHRTWSLSGQVHMVDPLGDREDQSIPFTELFVLGRRPQDLSGFLPGTLRGQSATILNLGYSYPIWVFLDGALNVSVGNAFGRSLSGFDVSRFRASIGVGIESHKDADNAFTFMFALGTSRFNERFAIDSFRFLVGTQTGF